MHRTLRRFLQGSLLPVLVSAIPLAARAEPRDIEDFPEPYKIPHTQPMTMEEIHDVVGKKSVKDGELWEELAQRAECGGWDMSMSVENAIASVQGAPGRKGDWDGNIRSGMALRDEDGGLLQDGYLFPPGDLARGWSTACTPGFPPYLDDTPPCQDESEHGQATPQQCERLCQRINRWQVPVWGVLWELWGMDASGNPLLLDSQFCEQIGRGGKDFDRDAQGGDCCERKGNGEDAPNCNDVYGAGDDDHPYTDPGIPSDAECNIPPGKGYEKVDLDGASGLTPDADDDAYWAGWHYCCTGERVDQTDYEACTLDAGAACASHQDATRNCVRCEGDGVPDPHNPLQDFHGEPIARGPGQREETGCRGGYGASADVSTKTIRPGAYVSFYRQYAVSYSRAAIPSVPQDVASRANIPVACYGFYDEFDPKARATWPFDSRCVIAAYTKDTEFREFYKSQRGKGSFGDDTNHPDPDPADDIRNEDFNAQEDLWYPNLGGGMSLLNGPVFRDQFNEDLTMALMHLDIARQRVLPQLEENQPFSTGALMRAFDDTVSNEQGEQRTFVEWWQKHQTEIQKLVHPAIAYVIFPAEWSYGLDPDDPFVQNQKQPEPPAEPPEPTGPVYDPRRKSVEVQLEIRDDLLGQVAAHLSKALLLHIRPEPVTVVIPMGSPTDFRAYKESWIRWKLTQENRGKTVPSSVNAVIEKLEEYAVRADEVRVLRTELVRTLAGILQRQNAAAQTVQQWLQDNMDAYRDFLMQRQRAASVLYLWQQVADLYRTFHDITNMPWCKNDRFTTPIYSLLDPWMPRQDAQRSDEQSEAPLPTLTFNRPNDFFMDFSNLRMSTGSVVLPILRPVQILADHRKLVAPPPGADPADVVIPQLPDLPPIPSIYEDVVAAFPSMGTGTIVVRYPDVSLPENIEQQLREVAEIVSAMDAKYKQFWDAVTKPRCDTLEGEKRCENRGEDPNDENQQCCVKPGKELFCRGWDQDTCVHVEMDLLERFTRIGARPAVLLREDFDAIGNWRTDGTGPFPPCNPQDWACLELHAETHFPRTGWSARTFLPEETTDSDAIRIRMFRETLQRKDTDPKDRFIYTHIDNAILPSFDVRPPIDLLPRTSTGSAASAASSSSP